MPTIRIQTLIDAPIEVCFNLARDVDAHTESAAQTNERVISVSGNRLVELGDEVTFEAKHFGIKLRLSSKITKFQRPYLFADEMTKGTFKSLHHEHRFEVHQGQTLMTDVFTFSSPFGWLGSIVDRVVLAAYMERFLKKRAEALKQMAQHHSQ